MQVVAVDGLLVAVLVVAVLVVEDILHTVLRGQPSLVAVAVLVRQLAVAVRALLLLNIL